MWYVLEAFPIVDTFEEMAAVTKSNISYELAGSTVIFTYSGTKPSINIKVEMIFTPKERRIESFSLLQDGSSFQGGVQQLMFYDGCTWDEWCQYGATLNNLYAIDKRATDLIRVYEAATQFFEIALSSSYPEEVNYNVTYMSGYGGVAQPEK